MKGNITLTIIIILGIVFVLGAGVAVRYYIQEKPTKELPPESGPQVLQDKKDSAKTEILENKVVTQQLEDPIKNWRSYSNTRYGYRLKYPPDWIIQEVNPNLVWLLNNENQKNYAGLTGQAPIIIEVYSSKSYKSIEEFMTTYNFILPSLKFSDSGDKAFSDRYAIVLHNEIIYTISGKSPSVPSNKLTSELFEKIYSTFEFININQTPEERDRERVEIFDGFKQAISLYVNITNNPMLCSDKNRVYSSNSGSTAVDGTGWLPIDWTKTPGGSLYSKLPLDPLNTGEFIYTYRCSPSTMTYEFNVKLESSGGQDLAKIDGGNNPSLYEIGTDLNLSP